MYWRVTPEVQQPGGPVLTTAPQVNRIEQFDAITSLHAVLRRPQPAWGPIEDFLGYPGRRRLVADEKFLLAVYRNARMTASRSSPTWGPGFNDRGFRLATYHPAQPRQWKAGEGPSSTLDHLFREVAIPELDPRLPMVMVTSWDDWNEDTGIEPSEHADDGGRQSVGGAYTQGYQYGGEGWSAVETLRRDVALLDRDFRMPS